MGCLVTLIVEFLLMAWMIESPTTLFCIIVLVIIIGIVVYLNDKKKKKRESEELAKKQEEERIALEKLIKKHNVPNKCTDIWYNYGHPLVKKKYFYMFIWADNEKLYFVDKSIENNIGKIEISIIDIEYYEIRGEVHREIQVSGGGVSGGGSSIGGAIAGGLIAGEVGAVIGSREKIKSNPITSKTITKDKRETFLNFFIDNEKYSMFFDYEGYNTLLNIIPDKAYTNIYNSYIMSQINKDEKEKIVNQIKKLAELRDEGILTEDEFIKKKKDLLSKI